MFACFVGSIVLIIDELEISFRMVVNLSNLIIFTLSIGATPAAKL